MGCFDLIGNGMLSKLRQNPDLCVDDRPHAIGHMLLMRPVDGYAFFTVAMIATGFLTGTVILIGILFSEFTGKFLL